MLITRAAVYGFSLLMESIRNCGDKTRFAAIEKDSEGLQEMSRQGA